VGQLKYKTLKFYENFKADILGKKKEIKSHSQKANSSVWALPGTNRGEKRKKNKNKCK